MSLPAHPAPFTPQSLESLAALLAPKRVQPLPSSGFLDKLPAPSQTFDSEGSNASVCCTPDLAEFLRSPISSTFGLHGAPQPREHKESTDSIAKPSEDELRYANSVAAAYQSPQLFQQSPASAEEPHNPPFPLLSSQDAQQFDQHTTVSQGSTGSSTPEGNAMKSLLEQYHQIWSTIAQQEQAQLESEPTNESTKVQVALKDVFSTVDIEQCIQKVSLDLFATLEESGSSTEETETTSQKQAELVATKIEKCYTQNQVPRQLCHTRAHIRNQDQDLFSNLRGSDIVQCRPHALSMQQAFLPSSKPIYREPSHSQSTMSSPQLQPTPMHTPKVESDVRSLLFDASDSDEIESLVFNTAADKESLFENQDLSDSQSQDSGNGDTWVASAFECNIKLFSQDIAGNNSLASSACQPRYKRLQAFMNID